MNIPLDLVWKAVAQNSCHASLLIGGVLLWRLLFRRHLPAQCFHLLWLLVAVRLLCPAPPSSAWSVFNLFTRPAPQVSAKPAAVEWQVRHETSAPLPYPEEAGPLPQNPVATPATSHRNLATWAASIWLGGVAFQIALLALAAGRWRRVLRSSAPLGAGEVLALAEACLAESRVSLSGRIWVTEAIGSPAVTGFWRPRLLLPRAWIGPLSAAEWRVVLRHEAAHLRRRDLAAMWLLTAARVVHWFNPLAWLVERLGRLDVELACDEAVLRQTAAPEVYGETLLRLARAVVAVEPQRISLPSAGIIQGKRAMRARLERIGRYTRPGFGRWLATGLTLLSVAVVLGATETPPTVSPPAFGGPANDREELPEWARGWKVIGIAIPSSGQIEHAYVTLQTPAGRDVQMTEGVVSDEGVSLGTVEWSGTPVRARITLQKGTEKARLLAEAALVSRDDQLPQRSSQVRVEAKMAEVEDARLKELPLFGLTEPLGGWASLKKAEPGTVVSVLDEKQLDTLLRKMQAIRGVDLLSAPSVTMRSQQRATVEVVRTFCNPSEYQSPDEKHKEWTPSAFTTTNVGVSLEVELAVLADGKLDAAMTSKVTDFAGFLDLETKQPVKPQEGTVESPRMLDRIQHSVPALEKLPQRTQAIFHTRTAKTKATVRDGTTVLLVLNDTGVAKPFTAPGEGKTVLALVTLKRMTPAMLAKAQATESTTKAPAAATATDGVPEAIPVEGKPGFVTSPHSPQSGLIDVRGLSQGAEVRDPYSGKMFRVP